MILSDYGNDIVLCSVKLAGGRGMNIGYIYNQSGELAITATQEALIRKTRSESKK